MSPFDEFQKWKTHAGIKKYLKNGKRLAYGARALIKGVCKPPMEFPGGYLVGDNAGTSLLKIKVHTAMKSGIEAADVITGNMQEKNLSLNESIEKSWLYNELHKSRMHRFSISLGVNWSSIQCY